jgi:hypothetical protein
MTAMKKHHTCIGMIDKRRKAHATTTHTLAWAATRQANCVGEKHLQNINAHIVICQVWHF